MFVTNFEKLVYLYHEDSAKDPFNTIIQTTVPKSKNSKIILINVYCLIEVISINRLKPVHLGIS